MNIIICEDDLQYLSYLKDMLTEYINNGHMNDRIITARSIAEVENYIANNSEITLYYLDIKLCDMATGFDIASKIRERDYLSPIVFITNYGDMMPLTYQYKLEALDYIVKGSPNEKERICSALDFARNRQSSGYTECLNIQNKQKDFSVPFSDICAVETIKSSHKLTLYYDNGIIEFYGLLKDIEKQLDNRFIKIHKSVIVNKDKIIVVDKKKHIIQLNNGCNFAYAANYRGDF